MISSPHLICGGPQIKHEKATSSPKCQSQIKRKGGKEFKFCSNVAGLLVNTETKSCAIVYRISGECLLLSSIGAPI